MPTSILQCLIQRGNFPFQSGVELPLLKNLKIMATLDSHSSCLDQPSRCTAMISRSTILGATQATDYDRKKLLQAFHALGALTADTYTAHLDNDDSVCWGTAGFCHSAVWNQLAELRMHCGVESMALVFGELHLKEARNQLSELFHLDTWLFLPISRRTIPAEDTKSKLLTQYACSSAFINFLTDDANEACTNNASTAPRSRCAFCSASAMG